jgi:hypothetical protein
LIATISKHVTTDNQGIGIRGDDGVHSQYNGVDIHIREGKILQVIF